MKDKKKIYILFGIALLAITLFLVYGLNVDNYEYNLSKRIPRVVAIIITGEIVLSDTFVKVRTIAKRVSLRI